MAISHTDHNHSNTPAARAACRKNMASRPDASPAVTAAVENHRANKIASRNLTTPAASTRGLKKPGTRLRTIGDLADVPRMLAHGCRLAWDLDWQVKVGERFNESEARIEIHAPLAIISLVWKDANPQGLSALWIRHRKTSVQHRLNSIQEGLDAGNNGDAWGAHGVYVGV